MKKLNKERRSLYFHGLEKAVQEIRRRRKNVKLMQKVAAFLENDFPEGFSAGPRAVLVRYITSPNLETILFEKKLQRVNIQPLYLEYASDKFVAKNLMKYYLCKMYPVNVQKKKLDTPGLRIADFNRFEGKPLKNVLTISDQRLVEFHHALFKKHFPTAHIEDFSHWFDKHRKMSKMYYLHYLSLFVCHGILFENFLLEKGEREFTETVVLPAFREVERLFGVKPIIIPLEPLTVENEEMWYGYSHGIIKDVRESFSMNQK